MLLEKQRYNYLLLKLSNLVKQWNLECNNKIENKTIEILQNRFVMGKAEQSLILSDIMNDKLSTEIKWNYCNNDADDEKFNFDILGNDEIMSSYLLIISLRVNKNNNTKIIGYLLDLQSICIMVLNENIEIVTINHDIKLEWFEINEFENQLLSFEYLNDYERVFNISISEHCYLKYIDLTKKYNNKCGDRVIQIESKWGQYLYDTLDHGIECEQFNKAIEILKGLNNNDNKLSTFY